MPKVSVIMPVYNGERYLREAIDSILVQSFTDFEFIIINDGSTDSTQSVIQSYRDNRIRLICNEKNLGITGALNKGITVAQGTYLSRMDADDISLPDRLQRQVEFLDAHPSIALVGTAVGLIDAHGKRSGEICYPQSPEAVRRQLFTHNPFAHGTVTMRRAVIQEIGMYDPKFLHNEDYDLWLRIGAKYEMANLREPLVLRRIHEKAITVEKETELVRFRLKTLQHAISAYYHNPMYAMYLVRPALAYVYRRLR